jgi:Predicted membrane protein
MTDNAFRDAMTRLAVDPAFRAELDGDTEEVARRLGLTPAQVGELRALRVESGAAGGPASLDPRLSKSSLFFGSAAHALAHHDVPDVPTDHVSGDSASVDHTPDLSFSVAGHEGSGGFDVSATGAQSLLGGGLGQESPVDVGDGFGEFGEFGDHGGFENEAGTGLGGLGGHVDGGSDGGMGDFGGFGTGGAGGGFGDGGFGGGFGGGGTDGGLGDGGVRRRRYRRWPR